MEKKQINRKHTGKKIVEAQDKIIRAIQEHNQCSWLEAKHEYFENKEAEETIAERIADTTIIDTKKISEEFKKKKSLLKLKETKLGVTVVLSLADCQTLGFTGEELTKEVVDQIRVKLGLFTRKRLAEERKKNKESQ